MGCQLWLLRWYPLNTRQPSALARYSSVLFPVTVPRAFTALLLHVCDTRVPGTLGPGITQETEVFLSSQGLLRKHSCQDFTFFFRERTRLLCLL